MTPVVERVAVLGLGLLGGSVAAAARRRGVAKRVAGATRRREVLEEALARGFVDEAGPPEAVSRGADLVVLATPVYAMADTLRRIAPELTEGTVVTDVGSVKAPLAETLPGLLPRGVAYVGSHPMAGSHHRGLEHAREDLFDGAPCIVATGSGDEGAERRVTAFWKALGARVLHRDPVTHDSEVAWMSHLPHALAFAFARALAEAPAGAHEVAGSGFRDFTRIAHSEPELWSDILTANRKALAGPLQSAARSLAGLSAAIEAGDADALLRWLSEARDELSPAPRDDREVRSLNTNNQTEPPVAQGDRGEPPAAADGDRGPGTKSNL